MNALAYIQSVPWMILQSYLDLIEEVAAKSRTAEEIENGIQEAAQLREAWESSPAGLAFKEGEPLGNNSRVRIREGGVAVMNIIGPIIRHADYFSEMCGVTSTERLSKDFNQALNAQSVNSILMYVASPGGEAFGIGEFAAMIHERTINKPVTAYIGGYGASAAYYIAAAADEVVIDSSAMIGSIGTVMEATDYTKAYESRGIQKRTYVSEQSPKKRPKMGTETGDAVLQQLVDDMAQVFVEDVARFRGVTVEKVLADFGQGGMMVGKRAVEAGLVDRVGSFEATLSEMAAGKTNRKKNPMSATAENTNTLPESGDNKGDDKMSLKEKFFAWLDSMETGQPASDSKPNVPNAPQIPPPPAQSVESDEVKKLKAENAKLKQEKITQAADAFVKTAITSRSIVPAEQESFKAQYVQAAIDDEANPLADGSRVKILESSLEKRPKHNLSMELLKSQLPKGAYALDNNEDPEAVELQQAAASAKAYAEKANGKKAS